ncbi:MAG: lysophospholipase [Clostridiales Family XIII bacterium]|jgi:alpha-beta hydrolase superfamily lysophospholipase|nr:lysophospholipase [Clostridiales Family XIII bacterium]
MGFRFSAFGLKSYMPGLAGYSWAADGAKAVLCLLHGTGEHARKYRAVAELFAGRQISTYAADLRGHGASEGPRGHIGTRDGVLEDVSSLISAARRENEGIPLLVFGHSLGGNIALHYRLCGGLSGVPSAYLASSPWLRLHVRIPQWAYLTVKSAVRLWPSMRLHALPGMHTPKKYRLIDESKDERLTHSWISLQAAVEGYDAANMLQRRRPCTCADAPRPVFIFQGTGDKICSPSGAQAFAEAEGGLCTLFEYPGYFHEVYNGSRADSGQNVLDTMADIILSFC